jgi:hypothetical protein
MHLVPAGPVGAPGRKPFFPAPLPRRARASAPYSSMARLVPYSFATECGFCSVGMVIHSFHFVLSCAFAVANHCYPRPYSSIFVELSCRTARWYKLLASRSMGTS